MADSDKAKPASARAKAAKGASGKARGAQKAAAAKATPARAAAPGAAAPTPAQAGTGQRFPLFYTNPAPIDFQRHRGKSFRAPPLATLAAKTNSVPLNVVEFPVASLDFVIAFAPGPEPVPVAVLGLRNNENLFINADGRWEDFAYLPAYIRRYPFIFMARENNQLTLCIDETPDTVHTGTERPLVENGKASAAVEQALAFCRDYHTAGQQTAQFARRLAELDLLVDRAATMEVGQAGQRISLGGLKVVSEARLAALDEKTFASLRERGYLAAIYAHLLSLNNLPRLGRRLNQRLGAAAAP